MKTNIRQSLAFYIHVLVVSLCQLGIVLFNGIIYVSVIRVHVCRVVSFLFLISVRLRLVCIDVSLYHHQHRLINKCTSLARRLSIQYHMISIANKKELPPKEQLKNHYSSSPSSSLSVAVSRRLLVQTESIIAPHCRWAEASIIVFVTVFWAFGYYSFG